MLRAGKGLLPPRMKKLALWLYVICFTFVPEANSSMTA